jgi:hypothetical protein
VSTDGVNVSNCSRAVVLKMVPPLVCCEGLIDEPTPEVSPSQFRGKKAYTLLTKASRLSFFSTTHRISHLNCHNSPLLCGIIGPNLGLTSCTPRPDQLGRRCAICPIAIGEAPRCARPPGGWGSPRISLESSMPFCSDLVY